MGRDCAQCGKPVVVGHHHVVGSTPSPDGMHLEVELRHYDCLPVALRDASQFVTAARIAAEAGTRDEALAAHLEGLMTSGS